MSAYTALPLRCSGAGRKADCFEPPMLLPLKGRPIQSFRKTLRFLSAAWHHSSFRQLCGFLFPAWRCRVAAFYCSAPCIFRVSSPKKYTAISLCNAEYFFSQKKSQCRRTERMIKEIPSTLTGDSGSLSCLSSPKEDVLILMCPQNN